MPKKPLTGREIRILKEMISEYEHHEQVKEEFMNMIDFSKVEDKR